MRSKHMLLRTTKQRVCPVPCYLRRENSNSATSIPPALPVSHPPPPPPSEQGGRPLLPASAALGSSSDSSSSSVLPVATPGLESMPAAQKGMSPRPSSSSSPCGAPPLSADNSWGHFGDGAIEHSEHDEDSEGEDNTFGMSELFIIPPSPLKDQTMSEEKSDIVRVRSWEDFNSASEVSATRCRSEPPSEHPHSHSPRYARRVSHSRIADIHSETRVSSPPLSVLPSKIGASKAREAADLWVEME